MSGFVSFDRTDGDKPEERNRSVDLRPSDVLAVESDAGHPGTCILRTSARGYRVDMDPTEAIEHLASGVSS